MWSIARIAQNNVFKTKTWKPPDPDRLGRSQQTLDPPLQSNVMYASETMKDAINLRRVDGQAILYYIELLEKKSSVLRYTEMSHVHWFKHGTWLLDISLCPRGVGGN